MMVEDAEGVLRGVERLEGGRVVLRRFREDDAGAVLEYGSDGETLRHLIWGGAGSLEEARLAVSGVLMPHMGVFAITERGGGDECIGCIDLRPDFANEKAGFGYVLMRGYWGRGYMSEALWLVLGVAFRGLGLERVESYHFVGNEASGRVMVKCGLVREGMSPRWLKVKGGFRDVVHYGVLREDWLRLERFTQ